MNKERLLDLAKRLREVPPDRFDIRVWECGTKACVLGWCCRWYPDEWTIVYNHPVKTVMHRGRYGFSAAAEYFDITLNMAKCLFTADAYPVGTPLTPTFVADTIDALLQWD